MLYWGQQALPSKNVESEYPSVPSGLESFPVHTAASYTALINKTFSLGQNKQAETTFLKIAMCYIALDLWAHRLGLKTRFTFIYCVLTKLLALGSKYFIVANLPKPSSYTKIRSGSQDVTSTYTRKSNLNPSIRNGLETYC